MMDCQPHSQRTTTKRTRRDVGAISLRSETVLYKATTPCPRQVLNIPLEHMYNNVTHSCEVFVVNV